MDGILCINKPSGMTSHDVVNIVRKLARQRHIGHAGTLDPSAQGVLVVCLGKATKVVEYLINDRKEYRAEITLGVVTDTYDAEGKTLSESSTAHINAEDVRCLLPSFRGDIVQIPPRHSAIKRAGQPLYKLARAGIDFTPEARYVTIYSLDVISWQPPRLTIHVQCSKGTYIRSLAHDIGQMLGCGAHLSHLLRTASGRFSLDQSSSIEELKEAFDQGTERDLLFALDHALLDFPVLIVDGSRTVTIRNGSSWPVNSQVHEKGLEQGALLRVYSVEGEIVAMARYADKWQPSKVF